MEMLSHGLKNDGNTMLMSSEVERIELNRSPGIQLILRAVR
jgi:hypothetical protein